MEIIRLTPEIALPSGEMLSRILTMPNGAYALHKKTAKGASRLDIYDKDNVLIAKNVPALSTYVMPNGNYFLLYEPTNQLVGYERLRRKYRLLTRKGLVIYDNIDCFTPLADSWFTMLKNKEKLLSNENGRIIGEGFYSYQKFDFGYAEIETLKNKTTLWTLYDLKENPLNRFKDGVALLKSGVTIAQTPGHQPYLMFKNGEIGSVTTFYSGQRRNIIALVEVKSAFPQKINYFTAPNGEIEELKLTDVYEFENGNFTALNEEKQTFGFYLSGSQTPLIETKRFDICFTPDGSYYDKRAANLYQQDGTVIKRNLIGLTDYGRWYTADKADNTKTIFALNGQKLLENARVIRTLNGFIIAMTNKGETKLIHQSGAVLNLPLPLESLKFEKRAF